uniref:F-box domain-containing protein n=1 Tax=Brassica campestris TaxID=3711 RepID=M4EK26_BRACM
MKAARLGSEEVMYPDRISNLPNDLLLRILSLAPVRTAMSTSLLSKRWKYVWKMMPTLVYDETCPYIGPLGFDLFCGVSLPLHEALKTLNLKLGKYTDSIDILLFPNIRSNLLKMTINLNYFYSYYTPITFPNNINVFETLLVLKLKGRIVLDVVDSPVCFPSLKILHLICVNFQCEESFTRLLLACPVLEDLFLQRLSSRGRFLFSMSVPSLQRLSITKECATYGSDEPRLEISTPCLKYLKIFDRRGYYNFLEDMPKLVEADVSVDMSKNEKLLRVLSSVEHLVICLYPSMVLDLTDSLIFNRLLHLELNVCNSFRSNLLLSLLKYFPNLQSLNLGRTYPEDTEDQLYCLGWEPSSVPKCLSFHLESIQWRGSLPETVFQKLVVLKLHMIRYLVFDDSPPRRYFSDGKPSVCFRSLKGLHLRSVSFCDEQYFCRLISACPLLEDVFFDTVRTCAPKTIFLPPPQKILEISTPCLKYLKIKNITGRLIFTKDMPNLVAATLEVDPSQTSDFLRILTSVEFLSIHLYANEVLLLADKISQRLLRLELCIYGKISRNLLLHLLKHSPKLRVLKLQEIHELLMGPAWTDPCQLAYFKKKKKERLKIKELKSMPKASTSCLLVTRRRSS